MRDDKRNPETTEPKKPIEGESQNISSETENTQKEEQQDKDDDDEGYVVVASGLGIDE
jgi:hypothetical protein